MKLFEIFKIWVVVCQIIVANKSDVLQDEKKLEEQFSLVIQEANQM